MDKKNLIAFLALSLGVLVLWNTLFPPPQRAQPKDAGKKPPAEGVVDQQAVAPIQPPDAPLADDVVGAADAPAEDVPLEFITLGSLEREAGYRMLVTLTNRGAAVERAELSSPRFRDREDRTGYLGYLGLEASAEGAKVRVVGAGTPAEKADLAVGNVIKSITIGSKTHPIKSPDDLSQALATTRPNREVTISLADESSASRDVTARLTWPPLAVVRPEIENIRMRDGTVPEGFVDPPSFLVSLATVGGQPLEGAAARRMSEWLEQGNWTITDRSETSVTFEREIPAQQLTLVKRYSLEPVPAASRDNPDFPGYNIRLDLEVRNDGEAAQSVAYQLQGPTGLPLEGWWYAHKISRNSWMGGAGLRDVVVRFQNGPPTQIDCATIAQGDAEPMGQNVSLAYVGVDAVYFSAVMIPVKKSLSEDWFDITKAIRIGPKPVTTPVRFTNVSYQITRKPVDLAPGRSQKDSYVIFIGPKRPELLAQYMVANDSNYSLRDVIYYGMWPFSTVARGMLGILHFFYGMIGNYGIAIIMLTVLVRGALFPISFKQTQNMARMQALKPELDRITEKYKTDMQKRSQAMQELYRKNKINPLGGCLPVLLQLPIFIGLYRALMIDIELRQAPLFSSAIRWCSDLAAPDMLYDWSSFMPRFINNGEGIFGLGPFFNLLPIVTVVLFLVSMKISMPEPTNEQAIMQQKMMKYMTGFMGLLFYKVASGLCIYFIASSLWGLGERRLLKRAKGEDASAPGATLPPPTTPTSTSRNGSAGRKGSKAKRKR